MILDIDIGNTRLKWRLSHQQEVVSSGNENGCLQKMLVDLLSKIDHKKAARIRVAHVLGLDAEKEITVFFQKKMNINIECAKSQARCGGVTNQYQQPEQLGVDRWLAVLTAFNRAKQRCCVVDCGSAITVDFVLDDGTYVGGYIVPGLQMLAKSLHQNTKLLPCVNAEEHADLSCGKSTADAIGRGIVLMAVSFIETSVKNFQKHQDSKVIPFYLTGGDAQMLMRYLDFPAEQMNFMPDLVLDGLAIALP